MTLTVGEIIEGEISKITDFGAFVKLENAGVGLVHISEVSSTYVKDIRDHLKENQKVKVKVLEIKNTGKIELSIKQAQCDPNNLEEPSFKRKATNIKRKDFSVSNFEQMLSNFSKSSAERLSGSAFAEPNIRSKRNRIFGKNGR